LANSVEAVGQPKSNVMDLKYFCRKMGDFFF
jgi:hypothetical protein